MTPNASVLLMESLPSRGAWIEILDHVLKMGGIIRRSPRGERGLKFFDCEDKILLPRSLPSRGAWIEIMIISMACSSRLVAPLAGSVD